MRTKIIATIGPATLDFGVFKSLLNEGTTYIRINTAYGNTDQYDLILSNLKREETAIGKYPVESVTYMRKIIEDAEKCRWD